LFGSGCSFNGLTRQGDDEFGGNADPVVANPNFNFAPGLFVVGLSVGSGPPSAASIRLFVAARFSRECRIPFSGYASGPAKLGDSKRIRRPTGRKRERPHISLNFGSRLRAPSWGAMPLGPAIPLLISMPPKRSWIADE
jgi:hypothetical protein